MILMYLCFRLLFHTLQPSGTSRMRSAEFIEASHHKLRTCTVSMLPYFTSSPGMWYEAEICAILLLLTCPFQWYPFLLKLNFSDFGRKPWTVVRHNSALEGATKLKFTPFCSS